MTSFDGVSVKVVIRDGMYVGTGDVVFEDVVYDVPLWDHNVSIDEVYAVAPRFLYDRLPHAFQVSVSASMTSQGGDGQGLRIVLELLESLRGVANEALAAAFAAFLVDSIRKPDSDRDE